MQALLTELCTITHYMLTVDKVARKQTSVQCILFWLHNTHTCMKCMEGSGMAIFANLIVCNNSQYGHISIHYVRNLKKQIHFFFSFR